MPSAPQPRKPGAPRRRDDLSATPVAAGPTLRTAVVLAIALAHVGIGPSTLGQDAPAARSREAPASAVPRISRWLLRQAIAPRDDELTWPTHAGVAESVGTSLYSGSAGVVLFFLEAARVTGDEAAFDAARRGGHHLRRRLCEDAAIMPTGLYTGLAGLGTTFLALADRLGQPEWSRALDDVIAELDRRAVAVSGGRSWEGGHDVIGGAAGIGLFLLRAEAHTRSLDPDVAEHAVTVASSAGDALIAAARPGHGGLEWRPSPDYPRLMPNLSHGTAGVALFLTELYDRTRETRFLAAALAGAKSLERLARRDDGGFLVPHHLPGGEDLDYLGWCHGPVGTASLFRRLAEVTGDASHAALHAACVRSVRSAGIDRRRTPGFWDNTAVCCGSAGVGLFFAGLYRRDHRDEDREAARALADDVLRRGTGDAAGLRWSVCEHRVRPDERSVQTGLMQGAAGIGLFLVALADLDLGRDAIPLLPPGLDSLF